MVMWDLTPTLCLCGSMNPQWRCVRLVPSSLVSNASDAILCACGASGERNGSVVDASCRDKTASFVRNKNDGRSGCDYFNGFEEKGKLSPIPAGVYNLSDLREYGEKHGYCPYFLARYSISHCNVIVYSYHYLLDPKIAQMVRRVVCGGFGFATEAQIAIYLCVMQGC